MRDYSKPLTIVLTGTGESTKANSSTLLEDLIFGNLPGDAQVDVQMIVPYNRKIGKGLTDAINAMKELGVDGKDFVPIVEPNCGSNTLSSASTSIQVAQGEALENALQELTIAQSDDRDAFFILLHNKDSISDISDITVAKSVGTFTTLNLSEGLVDYFEGYESEEDRIKREELERGYAELQKQKAAEEEVANPKPAKKTAAKKAVAPRKRAISKPLEAEDVPLVDEPEKAPVAPEKTGLQQLVEDSVQREADKKAARHQFATYDGGAGTTDGLCVKCGCDFTEPTPMCVAKPTELSGTVTMNNEPGEIVKLDAKVVETTEVWAEVAKAVPAMADSVLVSKADVVQLGDAMQKMAEGFSEAIQVYKKIVEAN